MSKTKKIKRLERKVDELNRRINILNFSNQSLMKEVTYKPPSEYYTPRPAFRYHDYSEEVWYNNISNYIYTVMDKEYRKVYDTDPMVKHEDIKFIVYMSNDLIYRLGNVEGYRDFGVTPSGQTLFRGWEVIEVHGREYIHFVRKL